MSLVQQLIMENLPARRRSTSKGWIAFNAPCCSHRGYSQDTRNRGNILFDVDNTIIYNCFNCGFKTKFDGIDLGKNFENLLIWLGTPQDSIKQAKIELLALKLAGVEHAAVTPLHYVRHDFHETALPSGATKIVDVATWKDVPSTYMDVLSYLSSRGNVIATQYDYYWSSNTKYAMANRLIIPFRYKNKIVGWTARYAGTPPKGTPKYFNSDIQPGYLFNADVIDMHNRKYVLLLEGPLDAIAVDGVAAMGSELSHEQLAWLQNIDKEIIVVPDRQKTNQGLITAALLYGWSVSFPDWEDGIKDAAAASAKYGRIYTLRSIIDNRTNSQLEINIKRQMFRN